MKAIELAMPLLLLLSACAMPSTTVKTTDTRPSIAITNARAGTSLVVDGYAVGDATYYNGQPHVLRLEPGTHEIEIRDASGKTLFRQTIFVESELKTIQVH